MNNLTTEQGRKEAAEKSKSMSQTKFTPGPWRQIERDNKESEIPYAIEKEIGNAVLPIADVCFNPATKKEIKANARLIAVAPEMYNMLERILSAASEGEINWTILRDAKNLLAKARGEQTTQP